MLHTKKEPKDVVSEALTEASEAARLGYVALCDDRIFFARNYAEVNNISLSEDHQTLMTGLVKTARVQGIELALTRASKAADVGDRIQCDRKIRDAYRYAQESHVRLNHQQRRLVAQLRFTARRGGRSSS